MAFAKYYASPVAVFDPNTVYKLVSWFAYSIPDDRSRPHTTGISLLKS
jgi:hypothetical protein